MKFIISNAALFLFITLAGAPASAVEQCRQLKVKADREACYDRQSKALAEKRQAAGADKAKVDPVDRLKIENDAVSKRLRGICRGC
jgi:glutamyl/glutaminyl-tRNA synthetase